MRIEKPSRLGWVRRLALAVLAVCGLVTIVGSGGGGSGAECSFFSNVCNPTGPFTFELPPFASVYPQRISVQAGGAVTVSVDWSSIDAPSFQWRRSADGGQTYVDIAGATSTSYTLANVQLADDGALFQVDVRSNGTSVLSPKGGRLAVSSLPGVVFQDGEFLPANWVATVIATPAQSGPSASDQRADSGGHPGAFRSMTHVLTAGPSSLRVLHATQAAVYTPSAQGAIYVIDFAEDCSETQAGASVVGVGSSLLVVQAGRSYTSKSVNGCGLTTAWDILPLVSSLGTSDLVQVTGPACGVAEVCPDFSANGQPLNFGYVRASALAASSPAASVVHGIDNWKVTVWRR